MEICDDCTRKLKREIERLQNIARNQNYLIKRHVCRGIPSYKKEGIFHNNSLEACCKGADFKYINLTHEIEYMHNILLEKLRSLKQTNFFGYSELKKSMIGIYEDIYIEAKDQVSNT